MNQKYYHIHLCYDRKFSWTPKYLKKTISIQQASQKLRFALFYSIVYEINISYFCKLWNYTGIFQKKNIFENFYKDMLLSNISLPHRWPFKRLSNFEQFLMKLHWNNFWTITSKEFIWPTFQSLFWRYYSYYHLFKKSHL